PAPACVTCCASGTRIGARLRARASAMNNAAAFMAVAGLTLLAAGCGGGDARADERPPAARRSLNGYRLPWKCGNTYRVNQGNHGDICGVLGDHVGIQDYAWDFDLPSGTPVLATRAGVVTFAETPSPPGSACFAGCPFGLDSPEFSG